MVNTMCWMNLMVIARPPSIQTFLTHAPSYTHAQLLIGFVIIWYLSTKPLYKLTGTDRQAGGQADRQTNLGIGRHAPPKMTTNKFWNDWRGLDKRGRPLPLSYNKKNHGIAKKIVVLIHPIPHRILWTHHSKGGGGGGRGLLWPTLFNNFWGA